MISFEIDDRADAPRDPPRHLYMVLINFENRFIAIISP